MVLVGARRFLRVGVDPDLIGEMFLSATLMRGVGTASVGYIRQVGSSPKIIFLVSKHR